MKNTQKNPDKKYPGFPVIFRDLSILTFFLFLGIEEIPYRILNFLSHYQSIFSWLYHPLLLVSFGWLCFIYLLVSFFYVWRGIIFFIGRLWNDNDTSKKIIPYSYLRLLWGLIISNLMLFLLTIYFFRPLVIFRVYLTLGLVIAIPVLLFLGIFSLFLQSKV
jgi:hypothetical protein